LAAETHWCGYLNAVEVMMSDSDNVSKGAAGKSVAEAKQQVGEMAGAAKESVTKQAEAARDLVVGRTSEAYRSASEYARSGYETASQQVSASPMTSVLIAVSVGIGLGWLLRGTVEEDHRRSWIDALMERGDRWRR
jgi:hypothetical protein